MECCCIPRLIYTERRTIVGAMLACAAVHTYPLQGPYIRGRQIFGNLKSLLRPGALSRRRHLRQYMYDYSTITAIFSSQSLMWGPFGIKYIQGSSGLMSVLGDLMTEVGLILHIREWQYLANKLYLAVLLTGPLKCPLPLSPNAGASIPERHKRLPMQFSSYHNIVTSSTHYPEISCLEPLPLAALPRPHPVNLVLPGLIWRCHSKVLSSPLSLTTICQAPIRL